MNLSTQTVFSCNNFRNTESLRTVRGLTFRIQPMNFKKEIGKRIRAEREKKGLSLDDQARDMLSKLGNTLSKSRVSNYEQGIRLAGPEELWLFSRYYGVPAAYLGCLEEEGNMTREEFDLLKNYRILPENERHAYFRRIETLALTYRDPLPDEKLPKGFKTPPAAKAAAPRARRKTQ